MTGPKDTSTSGTGDKTRPNASDWIRLFADLSKNLSDVLRRIADWWERFRDYRDRSHGMNPV